MFLTRNNWHLQQRHIPGKKVSCTRSTLLAVANAEALFSHARMWRFSKISLLDREIYRVNWGYSVQEGRSAQKGCGWSRANPSSGQVVVASAVSSEIPWWRGKEKTTLIANNFNSISKLFFEVKFEIYAICIRSKTGLHFQAARTCFCFKMTVFKKSHHNEKSENVQNKAASMNSWPRAWTNSILQSKLLVVIVATMQLVGWGSVAF